MWRDVALANRDALLAEIDGYATALAAARAMIEAGDADAIGALFGAASEARRRWSPK